MHDTVDATACRSEIVRRSKYVELNDIRVLRPIGIDPVRSVKYRRREFEGIRERKRLAQPAADITEGARYQDLGWHVFTSFRF